MRALLLLTALFYLSGCAIGRSIAKDFRDVFAKAAPDETIEICVFASADETIDCYPYSVKNAKRLSDEPTTVYNTAGDLPPGFFLNPGDYAAVRRTVRFFVPQSEVFRLQSKYDIPDDVVKTLLLESM